MDRKARGEEKMRTLSAKATKKGKAIAVTLMQNDDRDRISITVDGEPLELPRTIPTITTPTDGVADQKPGGSPLVRRPGNQAGGGSTLNRRHYNGNKTLVGQITIGDSGSKLRRR